MAIRRLRALAPAMLALGAMLAVAAPASASDTSIYLASGPGYSLTFKAEGGRVFATFLGSTTYCHGDGSHKDERNEGSFSSFKERPVELHRAGAHLRLVIDEESPFESDLQTIDAELRPDGIVGSYSKVSSGEGLGGTCQTNSYEGDPGVPFEAVRYVPLGSDQAAASDPGAQAVYFANTDPFEIYFWVGGGRMEARGSAGRSCAGRWHGYYPRRQAFELSSTLHLTRAGGRFDARSGEGTYFEVESSRILGAVGDREIVGSLRLRAVAWRHGHSYFWCRATGSGKNGNVGYRAIRYVPAAEPEP
jgi:hypothetical protein